MGKPKRRGLEFSEKQRFLFKWWCSEDFRGYDGVICDGAVRSGKTSCMALSFLVWSMGRFNGRNFGLCGKTIISLRRNLLTELLRWAQKLGFTVTENISKNYMDVDFGGRRNRYYLFGGKDEASASLIQGVTLAGVLMDETALMPRSFVEQAVARCSVTGSKLWFNCNPDHPYHWFKREWIDKAAVKNLLYIHFDLSDNPSLSEAVIKRYKRLYTGAFYERFVLGKWSAAEGLVYPMFDERKYVCGELPEKYERFVVSCDYGTVNPSSFGLWGFSGGIWYRIEEYYYDSAREGSRRTDEEHYGALEELAGERDIDYVVCDPSAASFIQCIKRHGRFRVTAAKNDVVSGIRRTQDFIREGKLMISRECSDILREFSLYRWEEGAGRDCPVKENDHAMDDLRYFVSSLEDSGGRGFAVLSV
ncbi:PBSX family phage terminase large subunit [Ruminococcus sp.]|uniref:PBSX family phage terminase large subunit n=1 Tax=Ruminococcus sp. TaxID=41978 RepID=UPI0025EC3CE1|nr:PBSX family phage terminase large subunit [Ruminococcus sp.]MBQ8965944.1 PBSX family phage terminase large subunit [Ruminococcus sp.]